MSELVPDADPPTSEASEPDVVVIVEDYPDISQLVGDLLRAEGYEVQVISRGAEVLGAVKQYRPTLLLLDLSLPDISGHEVLRQLGQHADTSEVPVIIVSAYAETVRNQPQVRGIVAKPFDIGNFLDVVAEVRQRAHDRN